MTSFPTKYTGLLAFSFALVSVTVVVRIQVGPPIFCPAKNWSNGGVEGATIRSTDLLLFFPLSFERIFVPQKFRAMEKWHSGWGATMRSNVPLFNFPGLQKPAFAGFFVGA